MSRFFYAARVVKVVDGDTVDVVIDLGFDVHLKQRVRLAGVNTPESRTSDLKEKALGLEAKAYVEDWFDGCNREVFIQTAKDGTGKFGRLLGTIYSDEAKTACLNEDLVDSGHARPYDGGKRNSWFGD